MTGYYKAKCPHCGQIDIVYNEQKTHKCSSCGNRNKMNINDPSINMGEADNPFSADFLRVICPYCGHIDIVPIGEKRHTCSACSSLYEVINNDGPKNTIQEKSTSLSDTHNTHRPRKIRFWNILIASVIILGLISLCDKLSNDTDPRPTNRDVSVMIGVKSYLRENLYDPKSYQEIEWSPSGINDAGQYYIRHKYRAKNAFGGYIIEEKIFYLDKSFNVIQSHNY